MYKLIIKLVVLVLLFIFIDRVIGSYLFKFGVFTKGNKKIEKILNNDISHELIILGSSRGARNIIASELAGKIKLHAYNFAFPGSDIDFHTQLLNLIINSGRIPKYILLAVDDDSELIENETINFRYDLLYPYAMNDKIKAVLAERGKLNYIFSKISETYSARNILWQSLEAFKTVNYIDPLDTYQVDGSMPLYTKSVTWSSMTYNNKRNKYDKSKESSTQLKKYKQFVNLCMVNNIKLIIVFTPNYFIKSDGFMSRIKELTGNNAVYLDYSYLITDKELFYDAYHLNKDGATKLSTMIAKDFNKYFMQSH